MVILRIRLRGLAGLGACSSATCGFLFALLAMCLSVEEAVAEERGNLLADPDVIELRPFPPGGTFVLNGADGEVDLSDLLGRVALIYFGYAHCPDVCPTSMLTMQQTAKQLPNRFRELMVGIFISVDPERDSPESLQKYVSYFDPGFLGLTGSPEDLSVVAAAYGAQYRLPPERERSKGYAVEHSSGIHVVDPDGRLRAVFRHTIAPAKLAAGVEFLLREYIHTRESHLATE